MTQVFADVLVARVKSWLWRAAGVAVVAGLGWLVNNVADLGLPMWHVGAMTVDVGQWLTTGLGLALGEVTKYFNKNRPWLKSIGQL